MLPSAVEPSPIVTLPRAGSTPKAPVERTFEPNIKLSVVCVKYVPVPPSVNRFPDEQLTTPAEVIVHDPLIATLWNLVPSATSNEPAAIVALPTSDNPDNAVAALFHCNT